MTNERKGGFALLAAQAALLLTMGFHPLPGSYAVVRAVLTHALAIFSIPIAIYGTAMLSKRLEAGLAFAYQLFALVIGAFAPIMSGFVATHEPAPDVMKVVWLVNQTCTRIWVGGTAIAFVLWSLASRKTRRLPRALSIYGVVCAALVLALVVSGLPFDVHHTTIVAVLEAAFYVSAGITMVRATE